MNDAFELRFDNSFVRELPGDPVPVNSRRRVTGACYSRVDPTPVAAPRLVAYSEEVAALLGLSRSFCETQAFAEVFAGNRLLPGMVPFAACYGGHQFGAWAEQLGDGRAISLGEVVNAAGERWELALKGAGPTPYSRMGDGRAVLRSSVREFLCSEAMYHLGVPTTRALSLVVTGEQVVRDMFYDGRPSPEPGAVVCRVAPSFLRFGNFELFAARGELDVLARLIDYAIRTHFPALVPELEASAPDAVVRWFEVVCELTATMITHWMRVGFVHGVMNTDNMSILGLTIDYGPYGWIEDYDPDFTPNTTDAHGRRYRFGFQPRVARWNLSRFAAALAPLVGSVAPFENALAAFSEDCERRLRAMLLEKLGLGEAGGAQAALAGELPELLSSTETDLTLFFRLLAGVSADQPLPAEDASVVAPLTDAYYDPRTLHGDTLARIASFVRRYVDCVRAEGTPDAVRRARMARVNPKYVFRNYLAQLAIDRAEEGDFTLVNELLDVLRRPYDEQPGRERYAEKRPEWARDRPGCSMLSCSS